MIEGLLVDLVEIFVHELFVLDVFSHLHEIYLLKVLVQESLCILLVASPL